MNKKPKLIKAIQRLPLDWKKPSTINEAGPCEFCNQEDCEAECWLFRKFVETGKWLKYVLPNQIHKLKKGEKLNLKEVRFDYRNFFCR